MITIEQFEDAVKSALQPVFPAGTHFANYKGEFTDSENIVNRVPSLPAVLYGVGGLTYQRRNAQQMWQETTLTLFYVAREFRGTDGMYEMLRSAYTALYDQNLGLDIAPIILGDAESFYADANILIHVQPAITQLPK